jgi:acid phosphatase (class A)
MLRQYTIGFLLVFISISAWANALELVNQPSYIDTKDITLAVIPAPPAADSLQQKMDTAILMWEQDRRTYYDAQRAWASVTLDPSSYNEALNARFEESRFPKLYQILKTVFADARLYVDAFKLHYMRERPYDADPNIKTVIPREESTSYPSGHATRGMTVALVLAEIFPEKREALLETGRQFGLDRVIGGVHYPSDIDASVKLAQALSQSIIASDAFKADVKNAQDEIVRLNQSK